MARRRRRRKRDWSNLNPLNHLKEETVQSILAIIFFVLAVFLILASMGIAGRVGEWSYNSLSSGLGLGYFLLPVVFILLGAAFLNSLERSVAVTQAVGAVVFFLSGLGVLHLFGKRGGAIGGWVAEPAVGLFDTVATSIILLALLIISFLVMFDLALKIRLSWIGWLFRFKRKEKEAQIDADEEDEVEVADEEEDEELEEEEEYEEEEGETEIDAYEEETPIDADDKKKEGENGELDISVPALALSKPYTPPPLSLLDRDKGKPEMGDVKANANMIKRTLQNFGIDVEMDEISVGPSVTRYALKPAEGVKLSRIVGLQNDLALALAAHPIRIEAPIPGKSLVGVEIPNSVKATIGLGGTLATEEFQKSSKALLVSLGKAITGQPVYGDINKMPHLLIAGSTGSGKSVTIHALINSLIFRNSPENLKFIMIDPKRVELPLYNKIPHLLTPVITDAKKAILALKWAAKEMDRRYDILEAEAVRDIGSYHKNVLAPELKKVEKWSDEESSELPEKMPYIVIMIDELADIMSSYPREMESAVVRLAQMSRAVGIHLVLSTQRPSVNIITGLIKANIPARIALQVSSQIDSRTILDTGGAEKLLGAGDMLYISGEMSKPVRLQSPFISETEVKNIVKFLAKNYQDEIPNEIEFTETGSENEKNSIFDSLDSEGDDEDDLYEEARETVVKAGKASTSYLQRKLKIGYARAARLMDMLEERGVVGPGEGAKQREVLERDDDYRGIEDEEER